VRPSAFAVLKLITRSSLVGCSTGRPARIAPFKIFATYTAAHQQFIGQRRTVERPRGASRLLKHGPIGTIDRIPEDGGASQPPGDFPQLFFEVWVMKELS